MVSVKPSAAAPPGRFNFGLHIDGAQVRCTYCSMKDLVVMAFRLKYYELSGPDWMNSVRFDLSAKLPEGATRAQVPAMLQSMMADRFQLKTHQTTKEFPVYALVVGKSGPAMKETPAEDTPQATNVEVEAGSGSATTVNLGNGASLTFGDDRLDATKVTMAALADQLTRFVERPVVDMTNLKGLYSFGLTFQAEDFMVIRIRTALSAGVEMPPQAMRLLENASDGPVLSAVETLGLKLESRKAPLQVLVVDSALKAPTEN